MDHEIIPILIFAVIIAAYRIIRHRRMPKREETDAQVIKFEIIYRDRVNTQAFLETYFAERHIDVLDAKCYFESGENEALYSSIYEIILPDNLTAAQLIGHISAYKTVQRVHTKKK